jgi:hypothetical protein
MNEVISSNHIPARMIQLELETSLGKALIEENGYSLLKIDNDS